MATNALIQTLAGSALIGDILFNTAGAAKPSSCRAFLTNGITLTNETTMATAAAAEVSTSGYARQSLSITSWTQDTTDERAESPIITLTFNPSVSTTYNGFCIALNANTTVGNSTGTLLYVGNLGSPVSFSGSYDITVALNILGVTYATTGQA